MCKFSGDLYFMENKSERIFVVYFSSQRGLNRFTTNFTSLSACSIGKSSVYVNACPCDKPPYIAQ